MKIVGTYALSVLLLVAACAFMHGLPWWRMWIGGYLAYWAYRCCDFAGDARRSRGWKWRVRNPLYRAVEQRSAPLPTGDSGQIE